MKKYIILLMVQLILLLPQVEGKILEKMSDGNYKLSASKVINVMDLLQEFSKINGYNLHLSGLRKRESQRLDAEIFGGRVIWAENVLSFLSSLLAKDGLALQLDEGSKKIAISKSREIRYRGMNIIENESNIPNDHRHVQYLYQLKHADSSKVARNFRPFMSRYGRVVNNQGTNSLIIMDTGLNVKRLLKILTFIDTPQMAKNVAELKDLKRRFKKSKANSSGDSTDRSQYIIFIVLFSLIGLIIGFMFRGYVIRRIEGGL